MNKSSLMIVIIIVLVVFVGLVVYKNRAKTMDTNPIPSYSATPTPVQNIDQHALDKELDQIDQMAKGIDDSNDNDLNDLNNLNK